MNRRAACFGFAIAGLLLSPIGYAQASDATITVVDESGSPTDVTSTLPDTTSDGGSENGALGQGVACQAKDQASEMRCLFGRQVSEQARDARADASGPDNHRP